MTIEIKIAADTVFDAQHQMRALLGGDNVSQMEIRNRAFYEAEREAGVRAPATGRTEPQAEAQVTVENTEAAQSPLPEPAPGPRKRGRRPKNHPAAAAADPKGPDSADSQPAVERNTGSAETGSTPSPETSPAADVEGAPTPPAPAAVTPEAFRAKLQETSSAVQNGYAHVCAALEEAGYSKVRDVKPEHYAEIMAKCDELVAGSAQS